MEYKVRGMEISDYDAVYALWKESEGIRLSSVDSRDCISSLLERNPGMSFVTYLDGEIVGAVLCSYDGRMGFLTHLAVSTDHRRNGIGKSLVGCCLYSLMGIGISKCTLLIEKENPAAKLFWEKVGVSGRVDLLQMVPGKIDKKR